MITENIRRNLYGEEQDSLFTITLTRFELKPKNKQKTLKD